MFCLYRTEEDNNDWSPPTSPGIMNTTESPSVQTPQSAQLPLCQSQSISEPQSHVHVECGWDSPLSIPSPVSPPLPSIELSGTPKSVSHQYSSVAPEFSPITNSNTSLAVSTASLCHKIYMTLYMNSIDPGLCRSDSYGK